MKSNIFATIVFVVALLLGVLFLLALALVKNIYIICIVALLLVIALSIFAEKFNEDN